MQKRSMEESKLCDTGIGAGTV